MVITVFLFTCVILLWINFLWSRRKYYAFALKIPGPLGLPIIGIAHQVYKKSDILYQLIKYARQYNTKTFFTWIGPYPALYTKDPKIAEIILYSPDCLNKTFVMDVLKDSLGDGLLTSKTPKWNIHRKLLNPIFSYKVLLSFYPLINKFSREFCDILDELVGCGEIDIKKNISDLSIRISFATTMGVDTTDKSVIKLMDCYVKLASLTAHRVLNPLAMNWTLFRFSKKYKPFIECKNYVNNFLKKLVEDKISTFKLDSIDKPSANAECLDIKKENNIFIERAIKIQQRKEFTIDDVVAESKIMLGAGYETSATTILSFLMLLAMHPQVQEKLFDEILAVFPDAEFDVRNEDFKSLQYLDMCINETLRLLPPIPLIGRTCTKDIEISKDIVVPKGTQLGVDIFNMHRDEDIWGPNASNFDPDHFLPANLVDMPKNSFIPFSLGPRNCLAWQYGKISLKISLTQIIRKYRFSTNYQFEDLIYVPFFTLRIKTVPGLRIYRR